MIDIKQFNRITLAMTILQRADASLINLSLSGVAYVCKVVDEVVFKCDSPTHR